MLKHSAASEHTQETSVTGIKISTSTYSLPPSRNPTENLFYLFSNECSLSAAALPAKRFVYHLTVGFFLLARSEQLFHV